MLKAFVMYLSLRLTIHITIGWARVGHVRLRMVIDKRLNLTSNMHDSDQPKSHARRSIAVFWQVPTSPYIDMSLPRAG
ncbi:hypothetical protein BDV33DRAFT_164826 [Aspergillus novoparasiticus]|uniref:Secreted protein n=1 Tax=Aspergillus novoparasiticus TaxID=986946 RepID=A0A5N6F7Q2_9EURO|nr:hypothetical protein BDV33DRAFT_164826 [Aspergillus novoparasiticus]